MKRTALILFVLLFPALSDAQTSAVEKLFDKYSGMEGFTTVYISSKMFSMFSEMEVGDPAFQQTVKGLKSIRILAADENYTGRGTVNFFTEIMKELPVKEFEELMVVKEKDQDVKFLVREQNGRVVELLLVVGGKDSNALISIVGDIDLKSISQLSKSLQIGGLENLEKIDKK